MPLDLFNDTSFYASVPNVLNFSVKFEPTKVQDKKYVINSVTDEYLGVVGHSFTCASHPSFFDGVQQAMSDTLEPSDLNDALVDWRYCRNNTWAMMDMKLPNVTKTISTDKHDTQLVQRIIALHAIDGSCSNQVFYGAIDTFCTNGMITGDYDKVRRKNSANFNMDRFIDELVSSSRNFYMQMDMFQKWASINIASVDMKSFLEGLMDSDRKAEKMFSLYSSEASKRGYNVFALYSAFTNYSSYADDRNGFQMRNTGNDTQAQTMWLREQEVSKWISSPSFKQLVAA